MSDAVLRVGVTGHRRLGDDPAVGWFVQAECVRLLDRLRGLAELHRSKLIAYSGLAVGSDHLFGRAAIGLGVPLIGVIPFADYPDDFGPDDRRDYEALLARCREVHRLPGKRRSDRAYMELGRWMVNNTDHLVAVWDGQPAAGLGGTGDVVALALRKRRTVYRIDPNEAARPDP